MRWIPILTTDEFEDLDASTAAELLRIRYRALVDAGLEPGEAAVVAAHPEVDLDETLALVRRGCPVRTALRILF